MKSSSLEGIKLGRNNAQFKELKKIKFKKNKAQPSTNEENGILKK